MVAIYNPKKCLLRLDTEYKVFFDLTLTDYQRDKSCEECLGLEEKECRLLLEEIVLKLNLK